MVEWQGASVPLADLCREHGIDRSTAIYRIDVKGWSVERAMTEPVRESRPRRKALQPCAELELLTEAIALVRGAVVRLEDVAMTPSRQLWVFQARQWLRRNAERL